jgi:hypothetical protein
MCSGINFLRKFLILELVWIRDINPYLKSIGIKTCHNLVCTFSDALRNLGEAIPQYGSPARVNFGEAIPQPSLHL